VRLKTAAAGIATLVVLAGGYQMAQSVSRERTSAAMPKPKYFAGRDGREYAIIQLCWEPRTSRAATQITIGPYERGEDSLHAPSCGAPWTRKGLVRAGDKVVLAWSAVGAEPIRVVRWRITIGRTERMGGNDQRQQALYACVVGVPPC
jgi:hypothetical protein